MKHLALLTLVLFSLPALGQSVTLPAAVTGSPGQPVIVMPSKIDGGAPKWVLDAGLKDVTALLLAPGSTSRAVVAEKSGTYILRAYNAKGDVASDIAVCTLTIGGGVTPTPPSGDVTKLQADVLAINKTLVDISTRLGSLDKFGSMLDKIDKRVQALEKNPVPVPTAKVARVTFVVFTPTKETMAVTDSKTLRDWITGQGLGLYGITTQVELDKLPSLKGTTPPAMVLQDKDGKVLYRQPISNNAEACQAIIQVYLK